MLYNISLIKMNNQCQICNEKKEGITCAIYHPEPNQGIILSPLFMKGTHWFVCIECNMCYLSQFMKMSNKGISDWLNWIGREPISQGGKD